MKKICLPVLLGALVPALISTAHADNFFVGQQAIAVDSSKQVTITGVQPDGTYDIQDAFGNTYTNIAASDLATESGCSGNICVNQQVIAVDSTKQVTVLALEDDGTFVIQDAFSNIYSNIAASDLAIESGCFSNVCVSQQVIAIDSSKQVTVLALESSGSFVVQDAFSNIYANITPSDVAVEQGCYGNLCVNEQAIALDSGKSVTILALEPNGTFVIQDAFSNIYTNIGASDLSLGQAPMPQPPMPMPQPPRPMPQPPMPMPQPPRPAPQPQPIPPRPGQPGGPGDGPGEQNPTPHPVGPVAPAPVAPAPVKPAPAPVAPAPVKPAPVTPAPTDPTPGQNPGRPSGPQGPQKP